MRKFEKWLRDPRDKNIYYWLADGVDWAEFENSEDAFQKEWPELYMWCALMLPKNNYQVYRWYNGRTGLNFVLVIHTSNDTLFQLTWEDHILEKA